MDIEVRLNTGPDKDTKDFELTIRVNKKSTYTVDQAIADMEEMLK